MTTAQEGLRSAIARRSKISLSRLTGAEIAAQMTDEQKAAMREKLGLGTLPATAIAKGSPWSPEIAASPAAKAATQRALDVAESPHFEANRDLAIQLLGNPKLSGAEIVAMLDLAGAKDGAGQDAALADMRAALASARALSGGPPPAPVGKGRSQAIWDRAYAKLSTESEQ